MKDQDERDDNVWEAVKNDLDDVADELEGIAEAAASRVSRRTGSNSKYDRFDPRRSQVETAKFVSMISTHADTVRRWAERIKIEDDESDA